MPIRTLLAAGFLLTTSGWANDRADRENLLGTWQSSEGDSHETWSIESKGDVLWIMRTDGSKATLEVKCKADGIDCPGTDEGKKVTIAMYFNGSALIQMETRDSYVLTRKFALGGEPGRLTIEVNPITGPGKHHTLLLTRHLEAAVH